MQRLFANHLGPGTPIVASSVINTDAVYALATAFGILVIHMGKTELYIQIQGIGIERFDPFETRWLDYN